MLNRYLWRLWGILVFFFFNGKAFTTLLLSKMIDFNLMYTFLY